MKVRFSNKKLRQSFLKTISILGTAISLMFTIIDFTQKTKLIIAICSVFALIICLVIIWILANKRDSQCVKINGTEVNIKFGNIFEQEGIKVIAFNEYFDTQVDDNLISTTSLNGIYIKEHTSGAEEIDRAIATAKYIKKNIVEEDADRRFGGKTTKYKIGTICPNGDYYLLAFTHFDEENRAFLSVGDFFSGLIHMWSELDVNFSGKAVSITLLGSGITRFNNTMISEQDLLNYIIFSFKVSQVQFGNTACLNIILDERIRNKINLYDIMED